MLINAFRAAAVSWTAALWLVPFAASRSSAETLGLGYPFALLMYGAGRFICHQRPDRSFHMFGAALPVCARCTGIYLGAAIASLVLWSTPLSKTSVLWRRPLGASATRKTSTRTVVLLSTIPIVTSLMFEWSTGVAPGNLVRAATGVPLGAAVAWIVSRKVNSPIVPAAAAEQSQSSSLVLLCVAAWAIPGAGHLWLGRRSKGLILLVALPLMFAIGLGLHGRLFPFELSEPLVGLAAFADLGIGAAYFIGSALGYGMGDVRSVTYEYGNAFLIVAGLLNLLVVIDAYDIAVGRK